MVRQCIWVYAAEETILFWIAITDELYLKYLIAFQEDTWYVLKYGGQIWGNWTIFIALGHIKALESLKIWSESW